MEPRARELHASHVSLSMLAPPRLSSLAIFQAVYRERGPVVLVDASSTIRTTTIIPWRIVLNPVVIMDLRSRTLPNYKGLPICFSLIDFCRTLGREEG